MSSFKTKYCFYNTLEFYEFDDKGNLISDETEEYIGIIKMYNDMKDQLLKEMKYARN